MSSHKLNHKSHVALGSKISTRPFVKRTCTRKGYPGTIIKLIALKTIGSNWDISTWGLKNIHSFGPLSHCPLRHLLFITRNIRARPRGYFLKIVMYSGGLGCWGYAHMRTPYENTQDHRCFQAPPGAEDNVLFETHNIFNDLRYKKTFYERSTRSNTVRYVDIN